MDANNIESVYFIGAGGIGMSALVRYFLSKGKKVNVVGSVTARAYTDRNGKANVSIDVYAQDVEFLSPRDNYEQQERQAIQNENLPAGAIAVEVEDIPF